MCRKVELLAPAGNMEGFYGAIHAGADAVYLGGRAFGARAYADNLSDDELLTAIHYAHIWNRKVYLTINTLMKENEFEDLYHYLLPLYEGGLDGVIIQDLGVLTFVKNHFPGMSLHVSTQMNLTGSYGALLLKELGAERIVAARELALSEIRDIKENSQMEIECFVHGAMCYCYSGQCLFSSILGGRSGNRGRCAQPCRLPYTVKQNNHNQKEGYPLSLKDLCTIEKIDELIAGGIDSFKIEGRMKKPEYTAGVTAIYRKYIDCYYNKVSCKVSKEDLDKLSGLYIRSQRQDGYYFKRNGKEMITLDNPSYGRTDFDLVSEIRKEYIEKRPKLGIHILAEFIVGKEAFVTVKCRGNVVAVLGKPVEKAQKQPITQENIERQLSKLGDTVFSLEGIEVIVSKDCFYPLKEINELRRRAVFALEEELIKKNGLAYGNRTPLAYTSRENNDKPETKNTAFSLSFETKEQFDKIVNSSLFQNASNINRIYIAWDLFLHNQAYFDRFCKRNSKNIECIIALPYIVRKDFMPKFAALIEWAKQSGFRGFLVRNIEEIAYLRKEEFSGKIYTDFGFYLWNSYALHTVKEMFDGFTLPLELKGGEQHQLLRMNQQTQPVMSEKLIYGYIPMMTTANCIAKTMGSCNEKGKSIYYLKDRYDKTFPVETNCENCGNVIYNCIPLSLHKELRKWPDCDSFRLSFTVESADEAYAVFQYYMGDASHNFPVSEYTTGHEKRGVE